MPALATAHELEVLLPAIGYRTPSAELLRQWRRRGKLTAHSPVLSQSSRGRREQVNVYDVTEVLKLLRATRRGASEEMSAP